MAIKDLIFLKQRQSAVASVVSAYFSSLGRITTVTGDKLLFISETQLFVTDYNGAVQLALDAPTGATIGATAKTANGDFLVLHSTGTSPNTASTVNRIGPSGVIWSKQFPANIDLSVVAESPDGSIVVAGLQRTGGFLEGLTWIAKLSGSTGALTWARRLDALGLSERREFDPATITIDAANAIYAGGSVNYPDFYDTHWGLAKFTSAGAVSWSRTTDVYNVGNYNSNATEQVLVTSAGLLYSVHAANNSDGTSSLMVVQHNPSTGARTQSKIVVGSAGQSFVFEKYITETPSGLKIAYNVAGGGAFAGYIATVGTSLVPSSAVQVESGSSISFADLHNNGLWSRGTSSGGVTTFRLKADFTFPATYNDVSNVTQETVTAATLPTISSVTPSAPVSIGGTLSTQNPVLVDGVAYTATATPPTVDFLYSTGGTF